MITVQIAEKTRYYYIQETGVAECWAWCVDQFGLPNCSDSRWMWDTYCKFIFKHETDAALFALRWV